MYTYSKNMQELIANKETLLTEQGPNAELEHEISVLKNAKIVSVIIPIVGITPLVVHKFDRRIFAIKFYNISKS